ncbi:tyrosinase family protein [Microcoleus sp. POL10_C6]|uniref:tyrosinase family protein n=1 Tax=Microcoleus sp. POL10_C6 TaxID=2818852 RepID=UPI002FD5F687
MTQNTSGSVNTTEKEPITIIGMGCRFPGGANSPEAFRKLLHTRVSWLMARVIAIVTVGLVAPSTFRAAEHSFSDNVSTGFRGGNALKALHKFFAITMICIALVFGMAVTPAEASRVYVRNEAHSPEAQEDIKSLKIALAKMRQMDCSNPLSWYYQGAIHWVPTGDYEMKYLESNPLCPSYTKSHQDRLIAWDNCTHYAHGERTEVSDDNFLVWHRLYLYHFENIVRALSGDKNFALPYWRYVSLGSTDKNPGDIFLTMPEAFRLPADDSNSLFEDGRFSKLLNGEKIEAGFAGKHLYNEVEGLIRTPDFKEFNNIIKDELHGSMHDYIGGGDGKYADPHNKFNKIFNGVFNGNAKTPEWGDGLMADVISAGFDPIFWMHHGNIDRLWDQWTNSDNGNFVTKGNLHIDGQDDWEYTFFDPKVESDGTIGWTKVKYTLNDVIKKVYNLGYQYDDTPIVLPPSKGLLAEVSKPSAPKLLASEKVDSVVSSDRPIDLKLPLKTEIATELGHLRANTSTPTDPKGYTLKVDVTYTGRPYGSYDVFLNLPNKDSKTNEDSKSDIDTYYAGSISFFVIPSPEPVTKTFQFDVTDELLLQLEKLGEAMDSTNLLISIQKASGPKDESLKIERVSLYAY